MLTTNNKIEIDLGVNDRENQVDTSATNRPCFTLIQSLIQRINQSITSKDNINLVCMTFNDDTLEKEFQLSIEERLLQMTKILGIFVAVSQLLRILALLFVGSAAIDGTIVARLTLIVLTFIISVSKFSKFLNLTPRRRATLLILVTYTIIMLIVLAPKGVTLSVAMYAIYNILGMMLAFTSMSILLVASSSSLVIMISVSFYLFYSAIHDMHTQVDHKNSGSLSEEEYSIFTSLVISIVLLVTTIITQTNNLNLRLIFLTNKRAMDAMLQLEAAKLEAAKQMARTAKELADANQFKIDFIVNIAHDIGNAILVMDAITNRLIDLSERIPAIAPCLKVMKLCITILGSSRERAMDCGRSKDGEYQNPKYSPVELYPLMKDLSGMVNLFMARSAVQFTFQIELSLTSHSIYSSPEWLSDMLLNLVSNASKYTEAGRIVVSVYQVHGGKGICLEVSDSGRGILDKYKRRLFQQFTRVETLAADEETKRIQDVTDEEEDKNQVEHIETDLEPTPSWCDKFKALFTKKSLVHPYPVIEDQLDLDDTSSGSPQDLEATIESRPAETPSNSRRRKEVTGTGLGLFSVSKKASKFGGYVVIQDNVPEGSLFSVIIPHMKLSRGMVKLDANSMNNIKKSLPHVGVNESGVCLPPPNPNRLDGIEFAEITGAIDAQSMNFDIELASPSGSVESKSSNAVDTSSWPSVLVVDDSCSIRKTWEGMLWKKQFKIVECEDGEQGLLAMKAKVFPFVVMDMQMPFLDGIQTTIAIREYEEANGKTGNDRQVILFCSGGSGSDLDERARNAGVDLISPKPCPMLLMIEEAKRIRESLRNEQQESD